MKKKDMSELAQIKIDLRNRTSMYENQKKRVIELSDEIKRLKVCETEKDELLQIQKETIIRQGLTIEEYKRMLFHKKPKREEVVCTQKESPDSNTVEITSENPLASIQSIFNQPSLEKRLKESYQKKIPRPVP